MFHSHSHTNLQASLPLPVEVLTIIGEFLGGENQFRSLANLNVASRLAREATNIPLWTTVILDSKAPAWRLEEEDSSFGPDNVDHITHELLPNAKYVRCEGVSARL
jgi:hypothetical protein